MGLIGGLMFAWITFIIPEWYVKIFTVIFSIMLFGYAYGFFLASFKNMKGYKVTINRDTITLPFLIEGKNIQLEYSDIVNVEKLEDFEGKTIVIHSKLNEGFIELEKKWMSRDDFYNLFNLLRNKANTYLKQTEQYGA